MRWFMWETIVLLLPEAADEAFLVAFYVRNVVVAIMFGGNRPSPPQEFVSHIL
jgi:hypothetical protein